MLRKLNNESRFVETHPDSEKDAHKQVELVKVQQSRVVNVQHVKHSVDLVLAEVSSTVHEHIELDVCRNKVFTVLDFLKYYSFKVVYFGHTQILCLSIMHSRIGSHDLILFMNRGSGIV